MAKMLKKIVIGYSQTLLYIFLSKNMHLYLYKCIYKLVAKHRFIASQNIRNKDRKNKNMNAGIITIIKVTNSYKKK